MTRTTVLIVAALIIGLILSARGGNSKLPNKKIVIEVDTPNGLARGESVIETRYFSVPWWYPVGGNRGGGISQRGEAAYVDLGGGRHVFVALNNQLHERPISHLFSRLMADGTFRPGDVPLLVTFSNLTDATTVREIPPDNFAAVFGPGYQLRRLMAVDTSDAATRGTLAARFPALREDLRRPAAQRFDRLTWRELVRGDVRTLGWDSFEAIDF